jgi:hypothetical protein
MAPLKFRRLSPIRASNPAGSTAGGGVSPLMVDHTCKLGDDLASEDDVLVLLTPIQSDVQMEAVIFGSCRESHVLTFLLFERDRDCELVSLPFSPCRS